MIPGANRAIITEMMAWVAAATNDEERATRSQGVADALLDGADEAEQERIQKLIASIEADAKKAPSAPSPATPEPRRRRRPPVRVYAPSREGYFRASREEATGLESSGTPFFGAAAAPAVTRGVSKEALEQLQKSLAARRSPSRTSR